MFINKTFIGKTKAVSVENLLDSNQLLIDSNQKLHDSGEELLNDLLQKQNFKHHKQLQLASNIWRVFCFFDNGKLVILLNGFQKKTQKTPKNELEKAVRLMMEYYKEKNK